MLDHALIEQRLAQILEYLSILEELANTPQEEFLNDKTKTGAAESYLRRSLEAIFDTGRHILAKKGHIELATEYKSIARGLKQKGFVEKKLGDNLIKMAGYRNRLVHMYSEVSDEELYSIINNNLGDIRDFTRQIYLYLKK